MRKIQLAAAVLIALSMGGCAAELAKFKAEIATIQQVYTTVTTATVPAEVVRPAANAFDILKGTAANFARYCVQNHFTPAGCDEDSRRKISTFVKQGTKARVQLRASINTGQPAISTVYNLLVDAVNGLRATPAATFTGG